MEKLAPIHPGEILLEDFLKPMGISRQRLAREVGISSQRISDIVAGRRPVTAELDLRLCRFFGLSEGYWLRGQSRYDTEMARDALAGELDRIRPWSARGMDRDDVVENADDGGHGR